MRIIDPHKHMCYAVCMSIENNKSRKKAVNVTLPADMVDRAKALNINLSQAAAEGIAASLKVIQKEKWVEENKEAIDGYNKFIADNGLPIKPHWLDDFVDG